MGTPRGTSRRTKAEVLANLKGIGTSPTRVLTFMCATCACRPHGVSQGHPRRKNCRVTYRGYLGPHRPDLYHHADFQSLLISTWEGIGTF